jgi:YD repeat-containing protein
MRPIFVIALGVVCAGAQFAPAQTTQNVPANQFCNFMTGRPMDWDGTGACSGNHQVVVPLSSLGLELSLYYNSAQNAAFNPFEIGKNFTFSAASVIYRNLKQYRSGDGTTYQLETKTVAPYNNVLTAVRTDLVNAQFVNPPETPNIFWRYDPDGTSYKHEQIGTSEVFVMTKAISRFGGETTINVGSQFSTEYIAFEAGGRIDISRNMTARTITLSRGGSSIVFYLDGSNRLFKIVDGQLTHEFTYLGTTVLMASSKSTMEIAPSYYKYDGQNRLVQVIDAAGVPTKYSRNNSLRYVETSLLVGQVVRETFNADGKISESMNYMVGNESQPMDWKKYTYNQKGYISEILTPSGKVVMEYNPTYYWLTESVSQYDSQGRLQYKNVATKDPAHGFTKYAKVVNGAGTILSDETTEYTTARPFLITKIIDNLHNAAIKTNFTYNGDQTKIERFNSYGIKVGTTTFNRTKIVSFVKHLAAADLATTNYAYNAEGQMTRLTVGPKWIDYTYIGDRIDTETHSSGLVKKYENYLGNGAPGKITVTYPTGAVRTVVQSLTKRTDSSLSQYTLQITHPSGRTENRVVNYSDLMTGNKVSSITIDNNQLYP